MSCPDLCTAEKCRELERRIAALETALELLEASFEAHTQQDIPIAHDYNNPHVESNLRLSASWQSEVLTISVADGESSDTTQVQIPLPVPEPTTENNNPHVKSNLSLSASWQSEILTISVADGESSDTATVQIPLPVTEPDGYDPHIESNLKLEASFFNDILTLSVADGESSDTTQVQIPLTEGLQTIFITEENNMDCCDSLSNQIDNAFNQLSSEIQDLANNLSGDLTEVKEYVTLDITGNTPTDFVCPIEDENGDIPESSTALPYSGKGLLGIHELTRTINQNLLTIFEGQCLIENGDAVAAFPAWWQVKLGANVPQIVCVFRSVGTRTYHSISIPHPKEDKKPNQELLPAYTKGNWQGMVICKDNSKFIINCATKNEAEFMCNQAIGLISSAWLESPVRIYVGERKGQGVIVNSMIPTSIEYYERGLKYQTPNWRFKIPPTS